MDERRAFGNRGEDLAVAFCLSHGYRIVDRNWSCRMGEIDLIAEQNGVTHFIEVKTRRTTEFGNPEESITSTKLQHLRRAIEMYLRMAKSPPVQYQADALAITMREGKPPEVHFIEGIL